MPQPNGRLALPTPSTPEIEPIPKKFKPTESEPNSSEKAVVPYTAPPTTSANKDFGILDFINDVIDDDIVLAATQMEHHYEELSTKITNTVVKKSPKKQQNPLAASFTGCKIQNIHIHVHKN